MDISQKLNEIIAELQAPEKPKARKGPGASNTGCANPIQPEITTDELGELLGYGPKIEPSEVGPDPKDRGRFVWLTDRCMRSAIGERFNDKNKPELGGTLHPSTPRPPTYATPGPALLYGIDTLYLMACVQLAPDVLEQLEALKGRPNITIASGPFRWTLETFGAAPHWSYVLSSAACTLKIRSRAGYDENVYIEVRSAFLWSMGAAAAVSVILEALQRWALQAEGKLAGSSHGDGWVSVSERAVLLTVSRIDLCADFAGDCLKGDELTRGLFVTRARRRTVYAHAQKETSDPVTADHAAMVSAVMSRAIKQGKDLAHTRRAVLAALECQAETWGEKIAEHVRGAMFVHGRTVTGFSFGAGGIVCRLYRKDLEIRSSGKRWFVPLWGNEKGPVWRVEFQLRTAGLNTFELNGSSSRDWAHVLKGLDGLWSHLTAREKKGWLSLRDEGTDKKRERWPVATFWKTVQAVRWSDATSVQRKARGVLERNAPRPARVRTPGEQIRAWCSGQMIEHETGRRALEMLGPQLAGLAAAYAAALQVRDSRADPLTDDEAKQRALEAITEAIEQREKDDPGRMLGDIPDKADRLVIRANWKRKHLHNSQVRDTTKTHQERTIENENPSL